MPTPPYPDEFRVDTAAAEPPGPDDEIEQLEALLGLRGALTDLHRRLHRLETESESHADEERKRYQKLLRLTVGVVDEFRRLLADARRNLSSGEANDVARDWLDSFGRLLASAQHQLEFVAVHQVPLLGADLNVVAFAGQSVKQWVAVQNARRGERLIVTEEILGLWVEKNGDKLVPIQQASVLI